MPADSSLPSPGPEILDYLARHPEAQDTIDGIVRWWIFETCGKDPSQIAKTIGQLVEQGHLETKPAADGHVFYRVSPQYLATLQKRPA